MEADATHDVLNDRQRSAATVSAILAGDPKGLEDLYGIAKNFRNFLFRQLGYQDLLDRIHDIFVITAQAVLAGKLERADSLIPFVSTIVRFYCYAEIDRRTRRQPCSLTAAFGISDHRVDLIGRVYHREKLERLDGVLKELRQNDREVIVRFYGQEQTREAIQSDLGLTPTQFRLRKSRALERARLIAQEKL